MQAYAYQYQTSFMKKKILIWREDEGVRIFIEGRCEVAGLKSPMVKPF